MGSILWALIDFAHVSHIDIIRENKVDFIYQMAHTPNHKAKTRPIRPTQAPIMAFQSVAGPSEYQTPQNIHRNV